MKTRWLRWPLRHEVPAHLILRIWYGDSVIRVAVWPQGGLLNSSSLRASRSPSIWLLCLQLLRLLRPMARPSSGCSVVQGLPQYCPVMARLPAKLFVRAAAVGASCCWQGWCWVWGELLLRPPFSCALVRWMLLPPMKISQQSLPRPYGSESSSWLRSIH